MDKQHSEQIDIIEKDLNEFKGAFDKHIEIYEKNNAEMKRLADLMENHMEEMKPVMDGLQAISAGRKGAIWVTSLIAAVGGAIIIIRKVMGL